MGAARLTGRRPGNPDAGSHRTRSRADQFPVLVAKTADASVGAGDVAVRNADTIAAEGAQVDRCGDSAAHATDRAARKAGVARRRQRMSHSRIRLRDQARPLDHRTALADEQACNAHGGCERPSRSCRSPNSHVARMYHDQSPGSVRDWTPSRYQEPWPGNSLIDVKPHPCSPAYLPKEPASKP